jgi:hypothetical protein
MNRFPTFVVWLAGLGFLGFGLWLLAEPVAPLAGLGIVAESAPARIELRTFYGGLEVGLGLWLLAAGTRPDWRRAALWLVLLSHAGLGLTRLAGIAIEGAFVPFFGWALAWELGFAALAAIALAAHRD